MARDIDDFKSQGAARSEQVPTYLNATILADELRDQARQKSEAEFRNREIRGTEFPGDAEYRRAGEIERQFENQLGSWGADGGASEFDFSKKK